MRRKRVHVSELDKMI